MKCRRIDHGQWELRHVSSSTRYVSNRICTPYHVILPCISTSTCEFIRVVNRIYNNRQYLRVQCCVAEPRAWKSVSKSKKCQHNINCLFNSWTLHICCCCMLAAAYRHCCCRWSFAMHFSDCCICALVCGRVFQFCPITTFKYIGPYRFYIFTSPPITKATTTTTEKIYSIYFFFNEIKTRKKVCKTGTHTRTRRKYGKCPHTHSHILKYASIQSHTRKMRPCVHIRTGKCRRKKKFYKNKMSYFTNKYICSAICMLHIIWYWWKRGKNACMHVFDFIIIIYLFNVERECRMNKKKKVYANNT